MERFMTETIANRMVAEYRKRFPDIASFWRNPPLCQLKSLVKKDRQSTKNIWKNPPA
jgi:hypothetical protein